MILIKKCENKGFCDVVMLSKDTKILGFNQHQKFDKTWSTIYEGLEYFIKRIDVCKTSFKKSPATKVGEHIPCGYSMTMIWTYDGIENEYDV